MLVNKVPGQFAISLTMTGMMVYMYSEKVDASHTINHFAVSDPENTRQTTTSVQGYSSIGFNSCVYYLKVSPAKVKGRRFYETSVNLRESHDEDLPGIVFNYDVEPLMTVYSPAQTWG
jgi:hypothetical protein